MRIPIDDFSSRRGHYFRDNFRRMVIVALVLLAINTLLLGGLFYQRITLKPSDVFVTSQVGDMVELVPREDPDDAVLARAFARIVSDTGIE